ncbi:ErfK/YbiS/YcfS/YnhG [Rhodopseudomonas palustris HaA2]|uniref:ErfK/YbiS/YcfS/YnhG n=1 Tax=Rhodopseudomonas palustris (strain HaA2) TaxID=316058 RepID=Q2IZ11_RHOP2|nr:L,D-transpeptidase [Rhodopseudomonas palustris]ABD06549.1 ErfK/YbiS/YcfS/YnhG [Rhodopseudomonas palustris HaA2]
MFRKTTLALLTSVSCVAAGLPQAAAYETPPAPEPAVIYGARQAPQPVPVRTVSAQRSNMGGGFIEFLFSDGGERPNSGYYEQPSDDQQRRYLPPMDPQAPMQMRQQEAIDPARPAFDPRYEKQIVDYQGNEKPGTIVVDTPNKFLYLVQGDGRALRYGIGVGRPGFTWSGVKTISAKREWPSWTPPKEMLARRPDLPRFMEGGPENPLGARAMYLGSSLYRIHGSNEPWTIGTNVSSGCIRMRNEDVIDLYGRVNVGARVVVI